MLIINLSGVGGAALAVYLKQESSMHSEYIEQRDGGYYVTGTRISLDSVVYSFNEGKSPEAIQDDFPVLKRAQI